MSKSDPQMNAEQKRIFDEEIGTLSSMSNDQVQDRIFVLTEIVRIAKIRCDERPGEAHGPGRQLSVH